VNAGTLVLATSSGSALGSTSAIIVNSSGTLLLGANNQINNSAGITLNGGTFAKGNFSEGTTSAVGIGALTLTSAGSHLDFGTGTVGALSFASFSPAGTTLAIDNWTGTPNTIGSSSTDRLIFDADQSANLNFFSFTGYLGATEFNLGGGFWEVVPVAVPEPSTWTAGALGLAAAIYALRRRRSFEHISRHGLVLCAAFSVSSIPVIQAAPTDEIIRAVSVHGVSDVSQASAKQFSKAFFAVALRVDPDDLPNYVDAAVKLRPDLAPTAVAIALKVACENWRTTSDPMLTSLTRHSTTGRAALCELIGQIVKRAVLGARDHAPEIARAAVATCPEMRQCILTAAIGAAPEAEEAIMRAVTSSSPPADTYRAFGFSLKQEAQVASPEQPPP
jgi:hypothetical protein